ncbi:MAG: class I SAM-dependent methyltransferase [Bacteroidetes bacterium]|nr:class I SAM-dependent methyltransferase [Bacteroidota bacterium]
MNERVFNQNADRLRSAERVERLNVSQVVDTCLSGNNIKSILDIGTGTGLFAEKFHERGIKIAGVDVNPLFIEEAKKYLPDAEFKVASAENLPFDDASFDAVFYGVVLHEVDDFNKTLAEAKRVSRLKAFILEWQYKTEDFGPPIDHRLKPEFVKSLSEQNGFKNFKEVKLDKLVLYELTK